jgi:hypothetical protein
VLALCKTLTRSLPPSSFSLPSLNSKGELVGNASVLADACGVITVLDVDFRYAQPTMQTQTHTDTRWK